MIISDSKYLISIYEELRSCVLGGHYTFTRPPGLDLFLKVGFLKWVDVHKENEARPTKEQAVARKPEFLSCGIEKEITLILANMILERSGNASA